MENEKLLVNMVVVILLLTAVNLFFTYNLYSQLTPLEGLNSAKNVAKTAQPAGADTPLQRIGVSIGDSPFKGSENAPITIVEFSDFQCPYCKNFFEQTLPQIFKNYIDTGKAKLVYRNFPLGFHEFAQKAAEASLCASQQDKFWEYHDKLFKSQSALAINNLKQYAKDLGLNSASFDKCLDSGDTAEQVAQDVKDGISYGVNGTPSFFINGVNLTGAQPYAQFEAVIQESLSN